MPLSLCPFPAQCPPSLPQALVGECSGVHPFPAPLQAVAAHRPSEHPALPCCGWVAALGWPVPPMLGLWLCWRAWVGSHELWSHRAPWEGTFRVLQAAHGCGSCSGIFHLLPAPSLWWEKSFCSTWWEVNGSWKEELLTPPCFGCQPAVAVSCHGWRVDWPLKGCQRLSMSHSASPKGRRG